MNLIPHIVEWFDDSPLPSMLPDPAIVLGGTAALPAFVDAVHTFAQPGELAIASAFTDATLNAVLPSLRLLQHASIDLLVLTSARLDAEQVLQEVKDFPWRSLQISWRRGLHAKIYTFLGSNGSAACLLGSHNLTAGGARHNLEAGVLFVSATRSFVFSIAVSLHAHIATLLRGSISLYDSLRFANLVADQKNGSTP
jgi:hypothetical protein